MTIKRAIKVLKDMVPKTCKMVNGRYVGGFEDTECPQFEAIQVAVEAIQKQIPKNSTPHIVQPVEAPIKIGNGRWQKGTTIYKCPNCKEWVSKTYKYCPDCGQALEWRDSE
ncbi:MAG: hypothetical protein UHO61_05105 [Acutalibacteraceae bacterium]|nr:hypothetical protein [Acutalibacteraceae bacterium]